MSINSLGLDSFDWLSPLEADDVDSFVGDAEQVTQMSSDEKKLLHIPPVNEKSNGERKKNKPEFKRVKLKRKDLPQYIAKLIEYVKDLNSSLAGIRLSR